MKKPILFTLLIAALALLIVPVALAQDAAQTAALGVVTGRVSNGTAGASLPAAQEVILHIVDNDFNEETFTTSAAADGTFRFENVPMLAERDYLITAEYNDGLFLSGLTPGDPAVLEIDIPVTIYETGSDASGVKIENIVSQLSTSEGALQIVQIVTFVNTSDRVYLVAGEHGNRSVAVAVPQGATYQDFMGGGFIVSTDGTQVYDTRALVPGEPLRMHLVYFLPLPQNGEALVIDQPLNYPLDGEVQVFFGTPDLDMTSTDVLASMPPMHTSSGVFPTFGGNLTRASGENLRYELAYDPTATAAAADSAATVPVSTPTLTLNPAAVVMIILGVGAIGLAVALFIRERGQRTQLSAGDQANLLMKQIAELDIQFKQGDINKEQYNRQRSLMKSRLMQLVKDQNAEESHA
jgi:hypothetical protein